MLLVDEDYARAFLDRIVCHHFKITCPVEKLKLGSSIMAREVSLNNFNFSDQISLELEAQRAIKLGFKLKEIQQ
jgi:hypothetical protein